MADNFISLNSMLPKQCTDIRRISQQNLLQRGSFRRPPVGSGHNSTRLVSNDSQYRSVDEKPARWQGSGKLVQVHALALITHFEVLNRMNPYRPEFAFHLRP